MLTVNQRGTTLGYRLHGGIFLMFYGELPFGKRFGECSISLFVFATDPVFVWQSTVAPI